MISQCTPSLLLQQSLKSWLLHFQEQAWVSFGHEICIWGDRIYALCEYKYRKTKNPWVWNLCSGQRYSDISEHELDEIVEGIMREFPKIGYLRMTGLLQSGGCRIQQNRVRESMRRFNPDGVLLRAPSYELFAEDGIKSAVLLPCGILMVTTNW